MRIALTVLLLALTLPARAAAQEEICEDWFQSRAQPGTEVVACDQTRITGPGHTAGAPPTVYHDDNPTRLAEVRVIGRGTVTGVFVSRFDREGLLMETTFERVVLPDGVGLAITLTPEGGRLARADTGEVVAMAPARVVRLDPPTRSPLSAAALEPVAAACLASRRGLYFDGLSPRREMLRQLRDWRAKRARLAAGLRAAARAPGDRRLLLPIARSLLKGNRALRALSRWIRRGGRVHGSPAIRAFGRESAREKRLRRRLRLDECSG